jgi:hypothetical protein
MSEESTAQHVRLVCKHYSMLGLKLSVIITNW